MPSCWLAAAATACKGGDLQGPGGQDPGGWQAGSIPQPPQLQLMPCLPSNTICADRRSSSVPSRRHCFNAAARPESSTRRMLCSSTMSAIRPGPHHGHSIPPHFTRCNSMSNSRNQGEFVPDPRAVCLAISVGGTPTGQGPPEEPGLPCALGSPRMRHAWQGAPLWPRHARSATIQSSSTEMGWTRAHCHRRLFRFCLEAWGAALVRSGSSGGAAQWDLVAGLALAWPSSRAPASRRAPWRRHGERLCRSACGQWRAGGPTPRKRRAP